MSRYDAVLFDAGETLVHPNPSFTGLLTSLLCGFGHEVTEDVVEPAAREAFDVALSRGVPWSISLEASRMAWTALYSSVLAALAIEDVTLPERIWREFIKPSNYTLFPDAMPVLRELRALGTRVGIVSNWEAWAVDLFELLGLTAVCSTVVVSGRVGIEKPDERIFKHALAELGLAPARVCYVGDSPTHDVAPASALGMGAVLIDRRGRHPGVHTPTISSLGQLSAVIA